jgi:hypothetical protein
MQYVSDVPALIATTIYRRCVNCTDSGFFFENIHSLQKNEESWESGRGITGRY